MEKKKNRKKGKMIKEKKKKETTGEKGVYRVVVPLLPPRGPPHIIL